MDNLATTTATSLGLMPRDEAEVKTAQAQSNFDSFRGILLEMHQRKGYRHFTRTFEEYVQTQFGLSARRAYQVMEEEEVAQSLKAAGVSKKLPGYQLRELAVVPPEERPQILSLASAIAQKEGEDKLSKEHLKVAMLKMNGGPTGSERKSGWKKAIKSLGFVEGAEVEVNGPIKHRGTVQSVSPTGRIYVRVHSLSNSTVPSLGGALVPYDIGELRIVELSYKPLTWETCKSGQLVQIHQRGMEGAIGQVKLRLASRAIVEVDGQKEDFAFSDLEALEEDTDVLNVTPEPEPEPETSGAWLQHQSWRKGNSSWQYDPETRFIASDRSQELYLRIPEPAIQQFASPEEWLDSWLNANRMLLVDIAQAGAPQSSIEAIAFGCLVKIPEERRAELPSIGPIVADLKSRLKDAQQRLADLSSQYETLLLEKESATNESSSDEPIEPLNDSSKPGGEEALPEDISGHQRGSDSTQHGGDSAPGEVYAPSDPESPEILAGTENPCPEGRELVSSGSVELAPQNLACCGRVAEDIATLNAKLEEASNLLLRTNSLKKAKKLKAEIKGYIASIQELEAFTNLLKLGLGQAVTKKGRRGIISHLAYTPKRLPQIFVHWEGDNTPDPESAAALTVEPPQVQVVGDRWNPEHFGPLSHISEPDGQLTIFTEQVEPPDPADYQDRESYQKAWDEWSARPQAAF